MKRNNIPLILMLAAGAVTWIITFLAKYTVTSQLIAIFIVLLIFYFLGSVLKWNLYFFDEQNEKKNKEAGEVIEKEAGEENEKKDSESKS